MTSNKAELLVLVAFFVVVSFILPFLWMMVASIASGLYLGFSPYDLFGNRKEDR